MASVKEKGSIELICRQDKLSSHQLFCITCILILCICGSNHITGAQKAGIIVEGVGYGEAGGQ